MSTATALAVSANTQATIAAEQAAAAHRAVCSAMMPTFNGGTAAPELARVYARCVDVVYPSSDPQVWRVIIAVMLLGLFIGMLRPTISNWRENRKCPRYATRIEWEVVAFGGFAGWMIANVLMLVAAGVWFVIAGAS